jgi:hypothetical protein
MEREKTENEKSTETSATTRRGLLLGGAVGLAGLVADAVISAQPASATQDSAVLLGADNTGATARTGIYYEGTNTAYAELANQDDPTIGSAGVIGYGQSYGVFATSDTGVGVYGSGNAFAVVGESIGEAGTGVSGSGTQYGVYGTGNTYGVYGTDAGQTQNIAVAASLTNPANPSPALQAQTVGTGPGVFVQLSNPANPSPAVKATTAGTGDAVSASITNAASSAAAVSATTDGTGDALKVVGRVSFSRSGRSTVAKNKKTVKVTLAGVKTSSMILATLQSNAGSIAVANAVPASGSFTINLTAAHSSSVKVAWFVIG